MGKTDSTLQLNLLLSSYTEQGVSGPSLTLVPPGRIRSSLQKRTSINDNAHWIKVFITPHWFLRFAIIFIQYFYTVLQKEVWRFCFLTKGRTFCIRARKNNEKQIKLKKKSQISHQPQQQSSMGSNSTFSSSPAEINHGYFFKVLFHQLPPKNSTSYF